MDCRLCQSEDVEIVYSGPIRAGGAGSGERSNYDVKRCQQCSVEFLHPFNNNLLQKYEYDSDEYWGGHKGTVDIRSLQEKHDPEQLRWLSEIGVNRFRDKQVADYGCAGGQFLDMLLGVAKETHGIDPATHFKPYLEKTGHNHFRYPEKLPPNSIDIGVSFDTLEHIEEPIKFLEQINKTLVEDGELFIGVPNQQDFLKSIVPEYDSFFYHDTHLFYYNESALRTALNQAGFEVEEVTYVHKYNLMNLIVWAKNKKPGGHDRASAFDEYTETDFRQNVEREQIASHILIQAHK
jgi:2-polyprenyl-3-methyl-5-hydroxy-6-metoxy-1,4-benzoquinol methylase